jgi:hypothetical protein
MHLAITASLQQQTHTYQAAQIRQARNNKHLRLAGQARQLS